MCLLALIALLGYIAGEEKMYQKKLSVFMDLRALLLFIL